MIRPLNIEFKG